MTDTPTAADSSDTFRAVVVRATDEGVSAAVEEIDDDLLGEGDVLVDVEYSSLNYKDGLALTGAGKIIRQYPMIPGIDLAGTVRQSDSDDFAPGDPVMLTGWGVGERVPGGYSERQRVPAEWLLLRPRGLSAREAMGIGTAGVTAMLCVMAIEEGGITPADGPVVVSGAAGGVGSMAVAILASLGYSVTAITGRPETHDYLVGLGATDFIDRASAAAPAKPLESERWAGAVDTVGSAILARILSETRYGGVVAACGLAAGPDLATTVMPFILRGVRLQGVEAVVTPTDRRCLAWDRLVGVLPATGLASMITEIPLTEVIAAGPRVLAGEVRGRTVVDTRR